MCRPVTIELWGHGQSPAPDDPTRYSPAAYIEELEHIRRTLGCATWLLCGYSIGAGITIRYTHEYPERVSGHLFTNSSSAFADQALRDTWRAEAEASAAKIMAGGARAIERIAVHPRHAKRLPESIYRALLKDAAQLSPVAIANAMLHTSPAASVRDIHQLTPELHCCVLANMKNAFSHPKIGPRNICHSSKCAPSTLDTP